MYKWQLALVSQFWEERHFLYHIKKLMQQKNINTKEILDNYPLQFTC